MDANSTRRELLEKRDMFSKPFNVRHWYNLQVLEVYVIDYLDKCIIKEDQNGSYHRH